MNREQQIYKVTLIGSAGNMALLLFKFVAAVAGHSSAMMADAVHSLSDFITDIIVLVFVKISSKPQDTSHDYGHGKFETFATFVISLALLAAAFGIIGSALYNCVKWAQGAVLETPGTLALWAALASIAVKELLYRYTVWQGKALNSLAMTANAWHHRSDALSSVGAAIGIGGAILLGNRWAVLDPLASAVVGLMLIRVALGLLIASVGELTERSLPDETEQEIACIIRSFPGVTEPHNLRTRRIGNRIAIEAHIRMDGSLPLCEAHDRATAIEQKLKTRFGSSTHVSLHMEPIKKQQ